MSLPPRYIVFCLLVLSAFAYGKYQGLDFGNSIPGQTSSGGSSSSSSGGGFYGGGYHNTGSSGGFHK
ncbi:MAG TPA: hypothetical protein VJY39_11425 [Acidisphaera sp.]|nr:hypothetical protein [Acidisphaera sp.]